KFNKVSIERSLIANPGKLISISGVEEALELEDVNEIFIQSSVGDIISDPTNNIEKSGHVIITSDNLKKAEEIFEKVKTTIKLETDSYYTLNEKLINQNARSRFGKEICWVCKVCDGTDCASGVPGMGAVGKMLTFQDNINALREYSILPSYIRENVKPDLSYNFLGSKLKSPLMAAPMTGAITNMNGAMDEYSYAVTVLKGCLESGSIGWLGDGATVDKYKIMLDALKTVDGNGVLICKPRNDEGLIKERFQEAEKQGILALGMDIDAFNFKTLINKNQEAPSRGFKELEKIRSLTKLPFILKGIMSVKDAELAVQIGVDAIVVSNHGGRVLDDMPGTARVLPDIVSAIKGKIPVIVDGGIRSGMDIFKMLALGAESVLLGRPIAIYAVGGEVSGIKYLFNQYLKDLENSMNITGAKNLENIKMDMVFKK
ncbi:MAG: alpha-hydroxy-acid oxidizing protein, partial [Leptospiraceae bacterium]|nr:alpha-hydroxy-acid oxidizing protein [Leptospiraceae bacterium]